MRPLVAEALSGLSATVQLARLRGRVRTVAARRRTRAAAVVGGLLLVMAAAAGELVSSLARNDRLPSNVVGLLVGDSSVSLTAALATAFVGVVFAPITGAAAQGMFPDPDLAGIRPSRLHRFFDGIWNSVLSPVGVSPLLLLVAGASLATPDGRGRAGALVLALSLWVAALVVMALLAWTIEYARRRWSASIRWYLAGVAALAVALAVLLDPGHGRTGFGLADGVAAAIAAGRAGQEAPTALAVVLVLLATAGGLVGGILMCRRALARPAAVERVRQRTGSIRVPVHPSWAVFTVLVTTLARTREVRRPILMMILVAMPMLFAWIHYSGGDPTSMLGSVTMVVPLAMSLGWGVNVFGVLGGAVTLLLAQPRAWRLLLRHVVLVQFAASVGIGAVLMVIAVLTSSLPWSTLPPYLAGLIVSSVVATGRSVRYSVERPHRTRLTGRGDPLVPPIVGMGYVIRIMLTAATSGIAVATIAGLVPWLALVVVLPVLVVAFRAWRRVSARWSNPLERARLAALVGAV